MCSWQPWFKNKNLSNPWFFFFFFKELKENATTSGRNCRLTLNSATKIEKRPKHGSLFFSKNDHTVYVGMNNVLAHYFTSLKTKEVVS